MTCSKPTERLFEAIGLERVVDEDDPSREGRLEPMPYPEIGTDEDEGAADGESTKPGTNQAHRTASCKVPRRRKTTPDVHRAMPYEHPVHLVGTPVGAAVAVPHWIDEMDD